MMSRVGVALVLGRGKSIIASLEISNCELWVRDHSRPPCDLSIISFSLLCVSSSVSPVAAKAQSSTNPVVSSFLPCAISIRSAL